MQQVEIYLVVRAGLECSRNKKKKKKRSSGRRRVEAGGAGGTGMIDIHERDVGLVMVVVV
jgi:hypothetical protein